MADSPLANNVPQPDIKTRPANSDNRTGFPDEKDREDQLQHSGEPPVPSEQDAADVAWQGVPL